MTQLAWQIDMCVYESYNYCVVEKKRRREWDFEFRDTLRITVGTVATKESGKGGSRSQGTRP